MSQEIQQRPLPSKYQTTNSVMTDKELTYTAVGLAKYGHSKLNK